MPSCGLFLRIHDGGDEIAQKWAASEDGCCRKHESEGPSFILGFFLGRNSAVQNLPGTNWTDSCAD